VQSPSGNRKGEAKFLGSKICYLPEKNLEDKKIYFYFLKAAMLLHCRFFRNRIFAI